MRWFLDENSNQFTKYTYGHIGTNEVVRTVETGEIRIGPFAFSSSYSNHLFLKIEQTVIWQLLIFRLHILKCSWILGDCASVIQISACNVFVTDRAFEGNECFFCVCVQYDHYHNRQLFPTANSANTVALDTQHLLFFKVVHHIHGWKAGKLQAYFNKDTGCRNQSMLTMTCECLACPFW